MSLDASTEDLSQYDHRSLRIAIIASRFNDRLVSGLMERTVASLVAAGLERDQVHISRVPGSAELPFACQVRARSGEFDAVIALGLLIAGETQHHDIVARSVTDALQHVALSTQVPVINGVIAAETQAQAEDRTVGRIERGKEFALAALTMAHWR
jgi:6,7-dimethyl-8-ribityllumazine synthase